jgi:hypothetical protein
MSTDLQETAVRRFLARAEAYRARVPTVERLIRIGSASVRIQVPGVDPTAAAAFLGAFYSAAVPGAPETCAVRIFDDADGLTTKTFPFDEAILGQTGKSSPVDPHGAKIAVNPVIGSISVIDWERGEIAVWVRDFSSLPYWYVATPLRDELAEVADRMGMDFVHAGGLGRDGRGVCLVGCSGAGKSTTVLRGVARGLETVGDDFVLTDGRQLFGVYGRAKAHRQSADFVGDFSGAVVGGETEAKLIVDLAQVGDASALVPEMEIAAICVPRRDAGRGLVPARRMDVLRELLIHTSIGLREVYPGSMGRMRTLVLGVPCWNWFLEREGHWLEDAITVLLDSHV